MPNILIIDGDFFANRVIGRLNSKSKVNSLSNSMEVSNFNAELWNVLISDIEAFSPYITNVVFVADNSTWRKSVIPFNPYHVKEGSRVGYKETREDKKNNLPYDYTTFKNVYHSFLTELSNSGMVPVIDIKGLEGDDNIMLVADKMKGKGNCIIFGSDIDVSQVVKDNVFYYRHIVSKDAPEGEFMVSRNTYDIMFNQDIKSRLLGGSNLSYINSLMSFSFDDKKPVRREKDTGIRVAEPFKTALIKVITGDKKDNIFPLLGWDASTGTRKFGVTENHLSKVLKLHGLELTEEVCISLLKDKEMMENLLVGLRSETGQVDNVKMDSLFNHFKHNMRMKFLNVSFTPQDIRDEFDKCWETISPVLLYNELETGKLTSFRKKQSDPGKQVISGNVPDELKNLTIS